MKRSVLYGVVILAAVVLLLGGGAAVYIYVSGGSGEASEPISAPGVAADNSAGTRFSIVPKESEVRFLIDKELRGQPFTAVGRTDQVAGEILIDPENPADTQLGAIRVNVRTLSTDNGFRDRAIRSQILMSARDEFEFSLFVPTSLWGLPDSITVGEPFTFQIVGDLTVRDITNPATFEATVTPLSETRLQGSAKTTVLRADYKLNIPSVPNVANVSEKVRLEIDFVAVE